MFYIALNDASLFELTDEPVKGTTKLNGETLNAITMSVQNSTVDAIKNAFSVEFNVKTVNVLDENKHVMTTYDGYTTLRTIATDYVNDGVFVVTLAQPTDLATLTETLNATVASLRAQVNILQTTTTETASETAELKTSVTDLQSATAAPDPTKMDLAALKEYLIAKTKTDLDAYLKANPITSSAHANTAAQYSCTAEKQQLLASAIAVAQLHAAAGDDTYQPSWNATGAECTYDWTLAELSQLAMEIEAVVHPLVTAQQKMEVTINAATDTATLLATDFSFPPSSAFAV